MTKDTYCCFIDSAGDAYAAIQLYHVLDEKRQELRPVPPRPHHAELKLPIPVALTHCDADKEDRKPLLEGPGDVLGSS